MAQSEQSIGSIFKSTNNLTPEQVERILEHQRKTGIKFGEAAVALGYVAREDVLWALSQQFNYPYTGTNTDNLAQELVAATSPFSDEAEIFRDLRTQLISSTLHAEGGRPALAVVSPQTGDGKSFMTANLAVAFSQLGGRTLLVDADMRTPRQHSMFGISSASGLSSILAGRSETHVVRPVEALPNLFLLPVGVTPPNPLELVQSTAFMALMAELRSKFDFVIVDTPAASHGSDAKVIAQMCGAALVITRKSATKTAALQKLVASVTKPSIKLAGVILNNA
jgi:protein-tyrosine kinase